MPTTSSKPRRATPRRKPRLRVISHSLDDTTRHVAIGVVERTYFPKEYWIMEVWTFDEWVKMAEHERPEDPLILTGIGFLTFREANGRREKQDITDLVQQATDAWYGTE